MKIAVIGAGASGMMFAVQAATLAGKSEKDIGIDIYEQNDRAGKKLLATGNGRCNLTNVNIGGEFYCGDRGFAKYALERFNPQSNIDFFRSLGLFTKTDSAGRVYPKSNQASSVLDCLRFSCERLGVNIICSSPCKKIEKTDGGFLINGGRFYNKVVFACGSAAAVKSFCGYELLSSLGHRITKTAPSLVKLTTPDKRTKALAGVRAAAKITLLLDNISVFEESGELQFAAGAVSGIAAMQLSAFASRYFLSGGKNAAVSVDFAADMTFSQLVNALLETAENCGGISCETLLSGIAPKKIGQMLLKEASVPFELDVSLLKSAQIKKLVSLCKGFVFPIDGTRGFSEAQVTAGGADTKEFNKYTLESKKHKGLYCCGEVLDVDGLCGGYNLQWAWSSARLCAFSAVSGDKKDDKNK